MRFAELSIPFSSAQIALLVLGAVVWIGGANTVIALHYRRRGKPWWHVFKGGWFPRLNGAEWSAVGVLFLLAMMFFALGIFV